MLETIKLGKENTKSIVQVAQYLTGYSAIKKADGIFSDAFAAHVTQWQTDNGLGADGIIGKLSWTKMAELAPTCSTKKNKKSVYSCAIQLLLGGLTVDGDYGSNTKKAVSAFQSANGLGADGVCGSKTWSMLIVGKTSSGSSSGTPAGEGQTVDGGKVLNNCVKYLQWDSKWKNVRYSTHTNSQTIGNSGCGPSSMAMILATWENKKITPVECCEEAYKNGYRTYDSGTSWGYFKYVFKHHDCFEKYIETSSVSTLEAGLREGALAVCSMNSNDGGFWTKGGHFIVARGCDGTYIYANDPNKSETPRKQKSNKFQSCLKQAFLFWPKKTIAEPTPESEPVKTPEPVEPSDETEITYDDPNAVGDTSKVPVGGFQLANPNGKIIDISKWQGTIDFKKLAQEVTLVIARVSCGSDKDVKIDEYAKQMMKYDIPFGVYCYSYAGDEAKAKDEAKKMVQYAEQYNPIFYVLDAEEEKITTAAIKAFAAELRKNTTAKIGCYVAHHRYSSYKYSSLQSLFDFTWIPRYGKNDGTIEGATKPSYFCDLWQYTSTGKIAGISGNVDMNVITGDGHDLTWFLTNDVSVG